MTRPRIRTLALALVVYGAYAAWGLGHFGHRINPDAVVYLRNARYWTEGRFTEAVSGYWSPLLSLCVAPFLGRAADPVYAGIVVLALAGAALVVATWFLLRRSELLTEGLAAVALVLTADATSRWGATFFPDVLLAASLMAAAAVLASPEVLERRRGPILAGVFGGVGYLAKSYGFPFFLAFLPMTLAVLHGPWAEHDADGNASGARRWRPLARAWGWGLVGFVALAGPWAIAVSLKLGTPTIGSAGRINHAIVGPVDAPRDGLWKPVPGRVTVWETPETRVYGYWSPFESADRMRFQVRTAWASARRVRSALQQFDWFGLGWSLAVLGPLLVLAAGASALSRAAFWFAGTFAVFAGGFLFVYFDYRYTAPFLKPLAIVWALALMDRLGRRAASAAPDRVAGAVRAAAVGLVVVSFAAHLNLPFSPYVVEEPGGTAFDNITVDARPHRIFAARLRDAGIEGPIASTFYWGGMYTAFWRDVPFVGTPRGRDADSIRAELDAVGATTLLVDPQWPLAASFSADGVWSRALSADAAGQPIDVYTRSAPR